MRINKIKSRSKKKNRLKNSDAECLANVWYWARDVTKIKVIFHIFLLLRVIFFFLAIIITIIIIFGLFIMQKFVCAAFFVSLLHSYISEIIHFIYIRHIVRPHHQNICCCCCCISARFISTSNSNILIQNSSQLSFY